MAPLPRHGSYGELTLPTGTAELPAKTMLFLQAGVVHDVVAKEDSTVLLIINWHSPEAGA